MKNLRNKSIEKCIQTLYNKTIDVKRDCHTITNGIHCTQSSKLGLCCGEINKGVAMVTAKHLNK